VCDPEQGDALIRVFIVGGIRLHLEALASSLAVEDDISVLGSAASSPSLADLRDLQPDVVLVDMVGSACVAEIRRIVAGVADARIVAVAMPESERCVVACAQAGIAGYVPRDASLNDLAAVVRHVANGSTPCPARVSSWLVRALHALAVEHTGLPEAGSLTRRESQILSLVSDGLSNKEIARQLQIELPTVKNHVHNILEKCGVHRRGEAVARMRARLAQE
jgi:DNA-binding NarL/FixJ family response regulator